VRDPEEAFPFTGVLPFAGEFPVADLPLPAPALLLEAGLVVFAVLPVCAVFVVVVEDPGVCGPALPELCPVTAAVANMLASTQLTPHRSRKADWRKIKYRIVPL